MSRTHWFASIESRQFPVTVVPAATLASVPASTLSSILTLVLKRFLKCMYTNNAVKKVQKDLQTFYINDAI